MSQYVENAIPYGSRVVTFKRVSGGASGVSSTFTTAIANLVSVVMENISVTRKLREVNQYNEVGKPSGSFGVEDFVEGSGVVQLPKDPVANIVSAVQCGDAFATVFDKSITDAAVNGLENFVVTSADAPEEQLGYKKQSIRYKKLYSAVVA